MTERLSATDAKSIRRLNLYPDLLSALKASNELLEEAGCFWSGDSAPRRGCECNTCLQVADNQRLIKEAEKEP